jgi:hypothetical protein
MPHSAGWFDPFDSGASHGKWLRHGRRGSIGCADSADPYDVLLCPDHLGLWPPFTPLAALAADIVGLVGFAAGTGQSHRDLSHFSWADTAERMARAFHQPAEVIQRLH